jgi:hypothetical protein
MKPTDAVMSVLRVESMDGVVSTLRSSRAASLPSSQFPARNKRASEILTKASAR